MYENQVGFAGPTRQAPNGFIFYEFHNADSESQTSSSLSNGTLEKRIHEVKIIYLILPFQTCLRKSVQDSLPLLPSQFHNENPYLADQKDYPQVLLLAMHFVKAVMANGRQSSGDMGGSPEPHRKAHPMPSCATWQHSGESQRASSSSSNGPFAALRRFSVGGRRCSL